MTVNDKKGNLTLKHYGQNIQVLSKIYFITNKWKMIHHVHEGHYLIGDGKNKLTVFVFQIYFYWFRRQKCLIFFGPNLEIAAIVLDESTISNKSWWILEHFWHHQKWHNGVKSIWIAFDTYIQHGFDKNLLLFYCYILIPNNCPRKIPFHHTIFDRKYSLNWSP